jgi:hypothetical protein
MNMINGIKPNSMHETKLAPDKYGNPGLHENGATTRGFAWDSEPFSDVLPKFG